MRQFRVILILISAFLLAGCDWFAQPAVVSVAEGYSHTFRQADAIPAWDDYFDIASPERVESTLITDSIPDTGTFRTLGTFRVIMTVTLIGGEVVTAAFDITVAARSEDYLGRLATAFANLDYAESLRANAHDEVAMTVNAAARVYTADTESRYFVTDWPGRNCFHAVTEYAFGETVDRYESYFTIFDDHVELFLSSPETGNAWQSAEIPLAEFIAMNAAYGTMSYGDLLNGITALDLVAVVGNRVTVAIPLSTVNFDYAIAADIIASVRMLGLADVEAPAVMELLRENVGLIGLTVVFDMQTRKILEIAYEYKALLDLVLAEGGGSLVELAAATIVIESATYVESAFDDTASIFSVPFEVRYGEITETDKDYLLSDDGFIDVLVDFANTTIFFTRPDDHLIYAYNYETHAYRMLTFDGIPEHLYLRDGILYVTIAEGTHSSYWQEDYVGAFAKVQTSDFTLIDLFEIYHDPWDIVVDEAGFVYISSASGQWTSIRSFHGETGQAIDSLFVFEEAELLYSDYTGRLYVFGTASTDDSIAGYHVDHGVFSDIECGIDDVDRHRLALSDDARAIYAADGKIYHLDPAADEDLRFDDAGWQGDAFTSDPVAGRRYLARDGVLFVLDDDNEILTILTITPEAEEGFENRIRSQLFVSGGVIVHVTAAGIEIVAPEADATRSATFFVHVDVGAPFAPAAYLSAHAGVYAFTLLSGSVDTSAVGLYHLVFAGVDPLDATNVITVELIVDVSDFVPPEITIAAGRTAAYGSVFVPPACTATDNLDPAPACVVASNPVDTGRMGDYEIVYRATDASGNVSRKSIVVTVVLPRIETDVARIEFGVAAADVIVDLAMQAVYYTDFEGKTLYRYDLATGITTSLVFDHMPERMFLDGTTLYVAIVMKAHSSFWFDEDQYGRIAVVDTATFTLTHLFDVDTDPYGLAAYGGVLFIAPGSGQWTVLKLYDAEDGHFIGTGCFLREKSPIVLDPLTGTLYTVTVGSSPRDLERYTHDADACAESYSSPFHGDYEIGDEIFLSPDRDYIFSTAGTYFHMNPAHGEELDYAGTFGYAYLSMYFDVAADRVYIGLANGFLYVADIGAYQPYAVAEIGYPIDDVVVADGTYYIVSVDAMTTMTSLLIAVPHGG